MVLLPKLLRMLISFQNFLTVVLILKISLDFFVKYLAKSVRPFFTLACRLTKSFYLCTFVAFFRHAITCDILLWLLQQQHNNHFTALCPGLPGWAGIRRNTHPPTILILWLLQVVSYVVIMAALCNRGAIIFLPCSFFPSIFFFFLFFSSPNLSGRRLDVYHNLTHGVALVRI